ncbi:hypothetical protein OUZ56_020816 [Daphnia magna]|uniref:Uncharacterized protein n=1 Tax=Daphnia magna TaxID=35525 RepID=A0ABQ9ZFI7_9CRUS|nr:hypothetical protein OUZ56_020816 [Daphnia magna]
MESRDGTKKHGMIHYGQPMAKKKNGKAFSPGRSWMCAYVDKTLHKLTTFETETEKYKRSCNSRRKAEIYQQATCSLLRFSAVVSSPSCPLALAATVKLTTARIPPCWPFSPEMPTHQLLKAHT